MSLKPGRVELGVRGTSVLSRTWTNNSRTQLNHRIQSTDELVSVSVAFISVAQVDLQIRVQFSKFNLSTVLQNFFSHVVMNYSYPY